MLFVILVAASCAADSGTHAAPEVVRCVVESPSGKTCYQHTTTEPQARVQLQEECAGSFDADACDDANALGTCHLGDVDTVVYKPYANLSGFVDVCRMNGGDWEPR